MYRLENRPHGSEPHISCVTGNLNVSYLKPTPLDQPVILRAQVLEVSTRKATIICGVYSGELKTVEAQVVAVRIADDKAHGVHHQTT